MTNVRQTPYRALSCVVLLIGACSSPANVGSGVGATSGVSGTGSPPWPAAPGGGASGVGIPAAVGGAGRSSVSAGSLAPPSPTGVAGMIGAVIGAAGQGTGGAGPASGAGGTPSGGGAAASATAGASGAVAGAMGSVAGSGGSGAAGEPVGGVAAASGAAGIGSAGSTGGNSACPHVQLKGTDICTIGDSWIQIPGNQVTTLEDHLRKAGVIGANDHFDRREVSGSTLSAIINTYNNKPMNCKILVMDGGGIDLFTTAVGNAAAVAPVVQKFKDFLQKVHSDGYVEHIIYSLYPVIPSTPNLNTNMKPGYSEACAASAVDCHLVDLEPLFMGQHIGGDRTHPDNAGGVIIGDAWWQAMQDNCIAQYRCITGCTPQERTAGQSQ